MKIKELNGLNIKVDKKLELMLAFHAVYLKKHPEMKKNLILSKYRLFTI